MTNDIHDACTPSLFLHRSGSRQVAPSPNLACMHAILRWLPIVLLHATQPLMAGTLSYEAGFSITVPDTAKIDDDRTKANATVFYPRVEGPDFSLRIYHWSNVKPGQPLSEAPAAWAANKDWVAISDLTEGRSDHGVPYVSFRTRMTSQDRAPFDSVMTLVRTATGDAYMIQIFGPSLDAAPAIQRSIRLAGE